MSQFVSYDVSFLQVRQFEPGTLVASRYELGECLGHGGAAHVFESIDQLDGRPVIIKLAVGDTHQEVLSREFGRLRGLSHPRLTRVLDFGEWPAAGCSYYTSETTAGVTLAQWAEKRPWSDVVSALEDALTALTYLHQEGIRHGDFTPNNVVVNDAGRGTLIDLGCSDALAARTPGQMSGTPGYLAPELSRDPDQRSDIFAVGQTLHVLGQRLALPSSVQKLADRCRSTLATDRPPSVDSVLAMLSGSRIVVPSLVPRALVGREDAVADHDVLLSNLGVSAAQRVMWLYGPAGIGRTRLFRELVWRSQTRVRVLEVSANAVDPFVVLRRTAGISGNTVHAMLELAERLAGESTLLVVDDVHQLAAGERKLLVALVRTIPSLPALGLLATSREAPPEDLSCITRALSPLPEAAVAEWLAPMRIPRAVVSRIVSHSGGVPAAIERVALACAHGRAIPERMVEVGASTSEPLDVRELSPSQQRAFAVVAFALTPPSHDELSALAVAPESIELLVGRGLVRRDHDRVALASGLSADAVSSALPASVVVAAHRDWAARTSDGHSIVHLSRAGELDEVVRRWQALPQHVDTRGRTQAAAAIASHRIPPTMAIQVAKQLIAAGEPKAGLDAAKAASRHAPDSESTQGALCAVIGECHMVLGAHEQADASLRRSWELAPNAHVAMMLSLLLIRGGRFAQARAIAESGLELPASLSIQLELRINCTFALAYIGRTHEAAELARRVQSELETMPTDPHLRRVRARCLGALGLVRRRQGKLAQASAAQERAYAIAVEAGFDDLAISMAGNAGVAAHQLGEWQQALALYQHGYRVAVSTGATSPAARQRFNMGSLLHEIGDAELARTHLEAARVAASRADLPFLVGASTLELATIARESGDMTSAARLLVQARKVLSGLQSARELIAVDIEDGHQALAAKRSADADKAFSRALQVAERCHATDLQVRATLGACEVLLAREQGAVALRRLEAAHERATADGEKPLLAELARMLARASRAVGAERLAQTHDDRARVLYERLAANLPPDRVAVYRERYGLTTRAEGTRDIGRTSPPAWHALVRLNRRLAEAPTMEALLQEALDAAIDLCGGERGFLLLRDPSARDIRVEVARNLDKDEIDGPHLKFSRSIAYAVLDANEPVVTSDARQDERFTEQMSVHAMRLKSVICAPIRVASVAEGVIYIDNRFQRGGFDDRDLERLVALADQAAIALRQARLIRQLETRGQELEAEREQVARLLAERDREIEDLTEKLGSQGVARRHEFDEIIGTSAAIRGVLDVLDRVVELDATVLIRGESGTGKELVARAVHDKSKRCDGPFVAINCGALPANLLEAELFGYERGAFTGADQAREGLLASASGGTVFLDELGEMPLAMQVKLLRVLQERQVRRLGGRTTLPIDVRIVCATNRDLTRDIAAGRFRQDLYFRVAVVDVVLPPLRERVGDIPLLVDALLKRVAARLDTPMPRVSAPAMSQLSRARWPGNVRELENVLTRATIVCDGVIQERHLELGTDEPRRKRLTKSQLVHALNAESRNATRAAHRLGVSRATLYRHMKRFAIRR